MRMRDVLGPKGQQVFTISADATLHDAIRTLVQRNIGSLMVVAGGQICGIITERDILRRAAIAPAGLREDKVRDTMTGQLLTAGMDDGMHEAMDLMTRHRVRHLPIVENGEIRGLISIGDVVLACLNAVEFENQQMHNYIHGMA
ncbi:MAG: CBS domain-containing protein [Gemmatimonadota bacterium]